MRGRASHYLSGLKKRNHDDQQTIWRVLMAIDFRLTSHQRELRLESRKFAADVLANARAAELLPTPEERFRAQQRDIADITDDGGTTLQGGSGGRV
jgi:hypothetical protein